jgi:hypothetical protein
MEADVIFIFHILTGEELTGTDTHLQSGVAVEDDEDLLTGASRQDWFFFDPQLD